MDECETRSGRRMISNPYQSALDVSVGLMGLFLTVTLVSLALMNRDDGGLFAVLVFVSGGLFLLFGLIGLVAWVMGWRTRRQVVAFLDSARRLQELGVEFYATSGTGEFMRSHGMDPKILKWPLDGGSPNAVDYIKEKKVDLVINIPKHYKKEELTNDYIIRRTAVDFDVPLITNLQMAQRLAEALQRIPIDALKVRSWSKYNR